MFSGGKQNKNEIPFLPGLCLLPASAEREPPCALRDPTLPPVPPG